jgi:hypothetical protein
MFVPQLYDEDSPPEELKDILEERKKNNEAIRKVEN